MEDGSIQRAQDAPFQQVPSANYIFRSAAALTAACVVTAHCTKHLLTALLVLHGLSAVAELLIVQV